MCRRAAVRRPEGRIGRRLNDLTVQNKILCILPDWNILRGRIETPEAVPIGRKAAEIPAASFGLGAASFEFFAGIAPSFAGLPRALLSRHLWQN